MTVFTAIIILLYLYAAVSDARTMTVPLWVAPACAAVRITELCMANTPKWQWMEFCCAGMVLLITFLAIAFMTELGGADALFASINGLVLGGLGVIATAIGFMLPIPMLIIWKVKNKEHPYPMIPFLFAGFSTCLLWYCYTGSAA